MAPWKAGARAALAITVNVGPPARFDYGWPTGTRELVKLFNRFAARATFFVDEAAAREGPDVLEHALRSGHEVALAVAAADGPDVPLDAERLGEMAAAVERVTGTAPAGVRFIGTGPRAGLLSAAGEAGFAYSANCDDDFKPYRHDEGVLELPGTPVLDDSMQGGLIPWIDASAPMAEFHGIYSRGGLAVMTLHPSLSGRPGAVGGLDRLFVEAFSYPDLWNASLVDIAKHWTEGEGGRGC